MYLCKAAFSPYALIKTTHIKTDWMQKQMSTQVSSIKLDFKEICKDVKQC